MKTYLLIFWASVMVSCSAPSAQTKAPTQAVSVAQTPLQTNTQLKYAWKPKLDASTRLINRIAAPKGFVREDLSQNSFAQWLRFIPLKAPGTKVYLHTGEEKWTQRNHGAVIDIDTGNRDLQQCADAVMRLKAEFHYSKDDYTNIHFNYTSGDRVSFEDWRIGRKPIVEGNKVFFTPSQAQTNNSYANFKKYMLSIFSYAGTASLTKELNPVSIDEIKGGDVFIKGGFPGHAVIVMDVAVNEQGEKAFLLAQSYMPAQDMHILNNLSNKMMSPWYLASEVGEELVTPEWTFARGSLKRWR